MRCLIANISWLDNDGDDDDNGDEGDGDDADNDIDEENADDDGGDEDDETDDGDCDNERTTRRTLMTMETAGMTMTMIVFTPSYPTGNFRLPHVRLETD